MSAIFLPLLDDLVAATRSGNGNGFRERLGDIWEQAQLVGPDELTAGIERIAPLLSGYHGTYAKAAVLAGAMVERGGSPLPLRDTLPERAAMAMELRSIFPDAWAQATGGRPLPDPAAGISVMENVQKRLVKYAKRRGLSERGGAYIALSWFDVDDWLKAMITVLAHREFRAVMGHRERVRAAAADIADDVQRAQWVLGLTLVLDDEPLIALDPASGRGFRLTMSGVGDNFQLHTLLSDRLIGPGLLDGERPHDTWIAAATTGTPGPFPGEDAIYRRFRLFDGHGAYVFPEGRPADIEPLDGTRVVVLHPPRGNYGWMNGRVYQHMEPQFTLDQELMPAEAADWLARVAPARETDIMGMNP